MTQMTSEDRINMLISDAATLFAAQVAAGKLAAAWMTDYERFLAVASPEDRELLEAKLQETNETS